MRERIAAFGGRLVAEPLAGAASGSPPRSRSRARYDDQGPGRRRSGAAAHRVLSLIDAEDDLEVVGEAADGRQAVELAAASRLTSW